MRIFPTLIIHGGAGSKVPNSMRRKMLHQKLAKILEPAYSVLLGKSALDAVVHAVKLLEDDPEFNAGRGSGLQKDGIARLTASVMDGHQGRFAAVLDLENMANPILVAEKLLKEKYRVLAGAGAQKFAVANGFKLEDVRILLSPSRRLAKRHGNDMKKMDTVGACALDRNGRLASATSTGGLSMAYPHRVSDSGMPIANYANSLVALSATGIGEEIIEEGAALKIATRVIDGFSLQEAFSKTFKEIARHKRNMGVIGVDRAGQIEAKTTTPVLLYAYQKGNKRKFF